MSYALASCLRFLLGGVLWLPVFLSELRQADHYVTGKFLSPTPMAANILGRFGLATRCARSRSKITCCHSTSSTQVFPDWYQKNAQEWWTDALRNWSLSGVEFSGIWLDMNEASSFCDGSWYVPVSYRLSPPLIHNIASVVAQAQTLATRTSLSSYLASQATRFWVSGLSPSDSSHDT